MKRNNNNNNNRKPNKFSKQICHTHTHRHTLTTEKCEFFLYKITFH